MNNPTDSPRRGEEETIRVHIHLYKADVDLVHQLFGGSVGFSKAIRTMVRRTLREIQSRAAENAKPTSLKDFPNVEQRLKSLLQPAGGSEAGEP